MKTASPRSTKTPATAAKAPQSPLSTPQSGRLAQLAAMMNQSPRGQAQLKLADEIQNSERVRKQLGQAAEINHAQTPVAQPRLADEEEPAQREAAPAPNRTGLPDQLKTGVESLSGISLDDVKVHYNSAKPAQLNALAYAQGADIHVAPGQEKHLPHEAWHIVQQKEGRVQPTKQMKQGVPVNDDEGLEREADAMGARAISPSAGADSPLLPRDLFTAHGAIQAKKEIKGEHDYDERGKMSVHFEERTRGSSAGMYGSIAFLPSDDGALADKIDLVQIASMVTNKRGQAEHERGKSDEEDLKIKETNIDTSGNSQIKDMVRGSTPEAFHIDLTFDKTTPRTSSEDDTIESAYNAERRGGGWEDPMDILKMGTKDKVLNEYNLLYGQNKEDITERKTDQDPGYNDGNGKVKETELIDFPKSTTPATFSFQTEINADGDAWGTALWGFSTLKDFSSDEIFVSKVRGPDFQEDRTKEMQEARRNFNDIFANPSSWTSPEALNSTRKLLKSSKTKDYEQGCKDLITMADDLGWTLDRINSMARDTPTLKKMAQPHLTMAVQVVEIAKDHEVEDEIFSRLSNLYQKIRKKF